MVKKDKIILELTKDELDILGYVVHYGMRKLEDRLLFEKETSIERIMKHINLLKLSSKIIAKAEYPITIPEAEDRIFEVDRDLFKDMLIDKMKKGKKIIIDCRKKIDLDGKLMDIEIKKLEEELKRIDREKSKGKSKEKS